MVKRILLAVVAISAVMAASCVTPSAKEGRVVPDAQDQAASPAAVSDTPRLHTEEDSQTSTSEQPPIRQVPNDSVSQLPESPAPPPENQPEIATRVASETGESGPGGRSAESPAESPPEDEVAAESDGPRLGTGSQADAMPSAADTVSESSGEPIALSVDTNSGGQGGLEALPEASVSQPQHDGSEEPSNGSSRLDAARSTAPDTTFAQTRDMETAAMVGQLLMLQFRTDAAGNPIRSITPEVRETIRQVKPGGVILFGENISTIEQTARFIADLQDASEIPLFISVDEEGGFVSRLTRGAGLGATRVPSAAVVGKTGDPEYARRVGSVIGMELRSLGINMNMAPVADVNTNPAQGVIARYERSYGTEADLVARMVAAMVEGLQSAGVSAVLKHFPGHGDTDLDTHTVAVVSESTLTRLRNVEFVPFQEGINAGVDGVMTAHIAYPKVSGDLTPATFSQSILQGVLRDELGFQGVIISDALEMGAVRNTDLALDPVVAAVLAGVDLVLSPTDPRAAHAALLQAVEEGDIPRARLSEAVERVLSVKRRRNLFQDDRVVPIDPYTVLGNSEHLRIVEEILQSAQRTSGEDE